MRRLFGFVAVLALGPLSHALAQTGGYIVQTPGRPPTFVNPVPGGGYVAQTPGQMPSNLNPMAGGG